MAKSLRAIYLSLLFVSLAFCAYEKEFANFDQNFANSDDKLIFHHQLKSIYIQTVINEDSNAKIEALKRLIISSDALKLDSKSYVAELKELSVKTEPKKNTVFVLGINQNEDELVLRLNESLKNEDLKKIELKEKDNYRYIFDFEASLDGGRKDFEFKDAKITVAQFNPQTTRLVLHSTKELAYKLEIEGKSLRIKLPKIAAQNSKKQEPSQAKNATNSAKATNPPTKTPQSTQQTQKPSNSATAKKEPLYVLKSTKEDDSIRLSLSTELKDSEIKQFSMRDKNLNRIVLSFEAALEGGRKNFSFGKDTVILTQYTPQVVRVVFSSQDKFKLIKENEGKSLILSFEKEGQKASKQAQSVANKKVSTPAKKQATTPQNNIKKVNTKNKIIVIDAGHGGKDGGAVNGKLIEKEIVLASSLKIGEELKKMGYKVFYTRTKDVYINLRDRTKLANDKKANLFISIHANAAPNKNKAKTMQGIETFFLSPARSERSKEVAALENKADLEEANYFSKQNFLHSLSREKIIASNRLAIDIQKNLLSSVRAKFKVTDGGVREAPFWVLVGAQDMPAVLIEIGYISHPEEGKRLQSKAYQELLAKGIALGIQNYFRNNSDD